MALKTATKFDEAPKTADAAVKKGYGNFPDAGARSVLQALANRVLGDSAGTNGLTNAGLAEGTNAHTIKTTYSVDYLINGAKYSLAAVDNVAIPGGLGTQGTACYVKYLVSVGTDGTAGSASGGIAITKGNEGAAAADAKLPDLPDGNCALGYFQILTTTFEYVAGSTDNGSTGITDTYTNLYHMPYDG